MVEARGLLNRLFIDSGLGKPVDMAQVKTIGFFTDGDRRLAHPKTLYDDVGCGTPLLDSRKVQFEMVGHDAEGLALRPEC